ncbi:hypothetical protein SAMN05421595_2133 [Austwickia chelonae]|nr:hypothetical protein [Austwickia chelonae]SEW33150.1 hypothetical protein SAMN05421595_2133 [Austwickia chelonae]
MPEPEDKLPMRPPFPVKAVNLVDLDLDLRNSRFPRDAQSQADAFHLMMTTAGEDCLQLFRDITRKGQLSSSDLAIAVEKDGRFIVLEGNRRLTCLQIWNNPDLLATDDEIERTYLARFQRLITDSPYMAPTSITVAIAPSEEVADPVVERKHAGGAGGAGTVEWGAAMKDRRRARNNPAAASRAMAFIQLVSTELEDDQEVQADLETVRTKRYTMIQRFVDRGVVRDRLGLKFADGEMTFLYGPEATVDIVRAVLHDFAQPKAKSGKTWARELDTVRDFSDYLEGYERLLPNAARLADPDSATSETGGTSTHSSNGSTPTPDPGTNIPQTKGDPGVSTQKGYEGEDGRPPRPASPQSHIFRGLVLDQFTNRIQEVVRQTSMLNVQRQTEVASVLLRVILELATYQYLKSHGIEVERYLDRSLRTAIKHMEPSASDSLGQAEDTSPLQKAFHETTSDSIRLVQYAVHDVHSGRTPNEVLILAARYQPVLISMNKHMGNTSLT